MEVISTRCFLIVELSSSMLLKARLCFICRAIITSLAITRLDTIFVEACQSSEWHLSRQHLIETKFYQMANLKLVPIISNCFLRQRISENRNEQRKQLKLIFVSEIIHGWIKLIVRSRNYHFGTRRLLK